MEQIIRPRYLEKLRVTKIMGKIVLSMDKSYIKSHEGIKLLNVIDFLLDG